MIAVSARPQSFGVGTAPAHPPARSTRGARRARVALALLVAGVVWACLPFLAGLLGAVVLCVIARPAQRRLAPRLGSRIAAMLLTLVTAVLLAAPATWLVAAAVQQTPAALHRVTTSASFARLATLHVGPLDVGTRLTEAGNALVAWASARAITAAGSVTLIVVNLLLALVGLYYLLPSAPAIWGVLRRFIPFSAASREELAERFVSITEAAVLGVVATAISQGLTVGGAFWLVGLPNPLFWGAVTGAVSILPILGASLVWAPGVVVLAADGRLGAAATLAGIGVVVASNIDNVVRPIIYRRVSGMHPMASLVGAFAGVKTFGLIGLLLGPLALAYCLELFRLYESEYGGLAPTSAASSSTRADAPHDA